MKKIKISSSTKIGSQHWMAQKVSAFALIPLIVWLIFSLVQIAQDPQGYLPVFFAYPLNAVLGIILISTSLYHGALGFRVILEDYVAKVTLRHFLIMFVNFIAIATAVAATLSIVRLHLIG